LVKLIFVVGSEKPEKRKMKTTQVLNINVLVELVTKEQTTNSGLIMAQQNKDENSLLMGIVRGKGQGFLLPFPKQEDDISALLENQPRPQYLPLEVELGDIAYFPKSSMEALVLDGKLLYVVPYPAIKVLTRDEGS
jgi:co-chaperonin GroES (HSP10)